MKKHNQIIRAVSALLILVSTSCTKTEQYTIEDIPKSRVIVLTDMLNEADDSQTMVRLLMYANRMDIEGLIAASSCHQYLGKNDPIPARNGVHPEEIHLRIDAYAEIYENLKLHEEGWPTPEYLHSKVGEGPPEFGMLGVGEGKTTDGSQIISDALLSDDPRPVWVCINTGASCLAQALFDMDKNLDDETFRKARAKLRVYDDAGQDNAGAWIAKTYPDIRYQRSSNQVFNFYTNDPPVTWDTAYYPGEGQARWARENIQEGHGPLGELYPTRMRWLYPDIYSTLEGGGTSTWIGFVNRGLYVPEEMTWGGWGGRFIDERAENITADGQLKWAGLAGTEDEYKPFFMYPQARDRWTDPATGEEYFDAGVPISRWRWAYQNDFEARMDWCLNPFEKTNHNPVAAFQGDTSDGIVHYPAKAGDVITLDASGTFDPDGDDVNYRWFTYPEAGSYPGNINMEGSGQSFVFTVPEDASGKSIHVILEVTDDSPIVSLYDYRRIVIEVNN